MIGEHHDLVNHTKKYMGERHPFFLDFTSWRKFKSRYRLDWQKLRFGDADHMRVPKERGIYVFTLELAPGKLPMHGYILYVGITGDDSDQNLYKRYSQYLLDRKNEEGRPAVLFMLMNWRDDLFFNFVPLPNKSIDLARIERTFIDAVRPPINRRDFAATIRSARAALFS